jgi:hypothetical protein
VFAGDAPDVSDAPDVAAGVAAVDEAEAVVGDPVTLYKL